MQHEPIESRFEGCLLGLAVGDALGASFQGQRAAAILERYPTPQDLLETPPEGELRTTSVTQMAIGVAEALVKCRRINERELCKRWVANYQPERSYPAGETAVLEAMAAGLDPKPLAAHHVPGGSLGSGAAARVAPVGLLFRHDLQQLWQQAKLSALPTHVHPLGIAGAQLMALAVGLVSTLETFDRDTFFARLTEQVTLPEFREKLLSAAQLASDADLAPLGSDHTALGSVVTAIGAFSQTPDSLEATLGSVLLLGGETSTLAALAGALSGAFLGHAAIPNHLLEKLQESAQLEILASKLCVTHQKITARA